MQWPGPTPEKSSCSAAAANERLSAAVCIGIMSACATTRPRGSRSAVEQSRASRTTAENAERIKLAAISSAAAWSARARMAMRVLSSVMTGASV